MSMDYSGFKQLLTNFKKVQKQHEFFIRKFLLEMGMRTLRETKKLTPVDTGNLRNRWELSDVRRVGDELHITIFNPTQYASFVEDGHWQDKRFLPIKHLETGSKKSKNLAAAIKTKYGTDTQGIMLKERWVQGYHMARISITKIEQEIPRRYSAALKQFMHSLGVG